MAFFDGLGNLEGVIGATVDPSRSIHVSHSRRLQAVDEWAARDPGRRWRS